MEDPLQDAFDHFDKDGDGKLDLVEIESCLTRMRLVNDLDPQFRKTCRRVIQHFDQDRDGLQLPCASHPCCPPTILYTHAEQQPLPACTNPVFANILWTECSRSRSPLTASCL
eukprot:COSAG01_NODE_1040_length_11961_cov_22.590794_11_plen_113_part_00